MIGIVILNYNTAEDVVECVQSIRKTTNCQYRIYVVDNRSTDGSMEILQTNFHDQADVVLLEADFNGGYSYGNNIGIKRAFDDGCDYILISNPDVIYYENSIDILYNDLVSNRNLGVVGPSTPSLDQDESQLLRKVYTPKVYLFSKKPFRSFSKVFKSLKTEYPYPENTEEMPYLFRGMVRGCSFLISSELMRNIGLFDDNVFLYSEEWILAKKIADKNLMCGYDRRAKALHKEATSTSQSGTGFQSYHLYLSSFYYLKNYTDCKKSALYFFYMQNIVNYTVKSLRNRSYSKLLGRFCKTQTDLLLGKSNKITK